MAGFGETLHQARAHMGVTLKEAEQATRINRHHLAALEDENFSALPPLIYQRGIVRNYATYLDLDTAKLLAMFEEAHGIEPDAELVAAMQPLNMPNHWAPNFAIIAFMVVMSAIVFAWAYSAFVSAEEGEPTVSAMIPTVTPVATEPPLPTHTPAPTATIEPTATNPTPIPSAPATGTSLDLGATGSTAATTTTAAGAANAPAQPSPTPVPEPVVAQPVEEAPPAEEPAAGALTLSFTAGTVGISISVVADGVPVYSGWLEPGQSTGLLSGSSWEIWTTAVEQTLIYNANADNTFVMPGQGEAIFPLP